MIVKHFYALSLPCWIACRVYCWLFLPERLYIMQKPNSVIVKYDMVFRTKSLSAWQMTTSQQKVLIYSCYIKSYIYSTVPQYRNEQ